MEVFGVAFESGAETIWREAPEGAFADKVSTFFTDLESFLAEAWPMVRSAMQKGMPQSSQDDDTGGDNDTDALAEIPHHSSSSPSAMNTAEADDYARLLASALASASAN